MKKNCTNEIINFQFRICLSAGGKKSKPDFPLINAVINQVNNKKLQQIKNGH